MKTHGLIRAIAIGLLLLAVVVPALFVHPAEARRPPMLLAPATANRPSEIDVRGPHGVPKGTALRAPTAAQLKALNSLQDSLGHNLQVSYNGLTATPRFLFSYSDYLTPPSADPPETIARDFLNRWRQIFRFSDEDLANLRLKSRAYVPDLGSTVMVFEQRVSDIGFQAKAS